MLSHKKNGLHSSRSFHAIVWISDVLWNDRGISHDFTSLQKNDENWVIEAKLCKVQKINQSSSMNGKKGGTVEQTLKILASSPAKRVSSTPSSNTIWFVCYRHFWHSWCIERLVKNLREIKIHKHLTTLTHFMCTFLESIAMDGND